MSTHGCTHATACNECCCDVILMVHLRVLSSVLTMPAPSMVMPHSLCLSVCLFLSKDGIAARLFPRQSILFPADEPLAVLNKPCVTSLRQPRTSLLRQLSSVYPRIVSPFAFLSATLRGICTHACGCRLKRIFEGGEVHQQDLRPLAGRQASTPHHYFGRLIFEFSLKQLQKLVLVGLCCGQAPRQRRHPQTLSTEFSVQSLPVQALPGYAPTPASVRLKAGMLRGDQSLFAGAPCETWSNASPLLARDVRGANIRHDRHLGQFVRETNIQILVGTTVGPCRASRQRRLRPRTAAAVQV